LGGSQENEEPQRSPKLPFALPVLGGCVTLGTFPYNLQFP
jgi:hypothetical protein